MSVRPDSAPMNDPTAFYEWWSHNWFCWALKLMTMWLFSLVAVVYAALSQQGTIALIISVSGFVVGEIVGMIAWRFIK